MQYQLRVPFRLSHELGQELEPAKVAEVGALRIRLANAHPYVVLTVDPFGTEAEARLYFAQVWGALAWLSARLATGFSLDGDFAAPTFAPNPELGGKNVAAALGAPDHGPVDALADGNRPTVVPVGLSVKYLTGQDVRLKTRRSSATFMEALLEGLRRPALRVAVSDTRLRTAIELLTRSLSDNSPQSQFLTLTSALEVLTEPQSKQAIAKTMLDDFGSRIRAVREGHPKDSDEWFALESLERDILFRSETSIRSRIRSLSRDAFAAVADVRDRADRAVWAYDQRSLLVHRGVLDDSDLSTAIEVARDTLTSALLARIAAKEKPVAE